MAVVLNWPRRLIVVLLVSLFGDCAATAVVDVDEVEVILLAVVDRVLLEADCAADAADELCAAELDDLVVMVVEVDDIEDADAGEAEDELATTMLVGILLTELSTIVLSPIPSLVVTGARPEFGHSTLTPFP